jgi:sulfate adenylyltransferase
MPAPPGDDVPTPDARASPGHLVGPYGGGLVDLLVDERRAEELRGQSAHWPSWDLAPRQLCDLELLLNGGFSPLCGFLGRRDYEGVRDHMRLADGTLWPIPVTLDVPEDLAQRLTPGSALALRDPEGVMLAALHVSEAWQPDLALEAEAVLGTLDRAHPAVDHLLGRAHPWYVAGALEGIQLPVHHDYRDLRHTPAQLRSLLGTMGWRQVVAFQTRNPLHRAHLELTLRAAREVEANLLVHPVVGMTKPGDVDHYTRVRCYQAVMPSYPHGTALLSLLPLAMRMAGPREAVWHAIIRRNYGVTHLIVGRDHAGPGSDASGRPFYGPYDAQELLQRHAADLGVAPVAFRQMVYVEGRDEYMPEDEVPAGERVLSISGTEQRRRLNEGRELPAWFTPPAVATELRRSYPPRSGQGFTVFFTGLSGSGKSTIANVLLVKLLELGGRPVTLLDGDIVRKHLSSELGFSREHRDVNIRRIGFVASEITKNGGIALCAPIAPYDATRREVRRMVEPGGGFVLVHVATDLETCEARDRKGLYAKARAGVLREFTGISDPYEEPADAEVVIDTAAVTPEEAAQQVILHLEREGYIGAS